MIEGFRNSENKKTPESKESPELFRATLGFDFVFSYDNNSKLQCYCIEINGHDSGVVGVQDIPDDQMDPLHKTLAKIRATPNKKMKRKFQLANEVVQQINSGEFTPSKEAMQRIQQYFRKSLRTSPTFQYANNNPDFIEDITRDKWLQEKYIPSENLPKIWHEGDSPVSSTGGWVVKPRDSRGGHNVFVLLNNEFEKHLSDVDFIADNVIQEFISSAGAQRVPASIEKRPASMRLLIDFRYLKDGTIVKDFETAYQRVGPHEVSQTKNTESTKIEREDIFIVNKARGATSAAVSPEELALARSVAKEIIANIATAYRAHVKSIA